MSISKVDIAELKAVLEEAYSIGKINRLESIACDEEELLGPSDVLQRSSESFSGEQFRTSFRVSTEGADYFLKRIDGWIGETRLAGIEEFIGWTESHNYTLSPSLKVSTSGQTHIAVGENRFQLFDFLEQGKRQIWMRSHISSDDCKLAGELLARMHLASAEYLHEAPEKLDAFVIASDAKKNLEALFERFNSQQASLHPVFQRFAQNESTLKEIFSKAIELVSIKGKSGFPVLVHGDFHPGNVLIFSDPQDKRHIRLVDFDYMCKQHPFYDIGYGLVMFARNQYPSKSSDTDRADDHYFDWKLGKAFLGGYVRALHRNPADSDEVQIRKSEIVAACMSRRLLAYYITFAGFLIMDWAVEKLFTGPKVYSDVYADVVRSMDTLLCDDTGLDAENILMQELIEPSF